MKVNGLAADLVMRLRALLPVMRQLSTISSLLLLGSLCVLGNSSVEARPAKNTPVASPPKQAPVRTDLTPRDTNDCLAVARTLNEQVKKLARQTRRGSRPSSLGSHRTLISHAVRRSSRRRGLASTG